MKKQSNSQTAYQHNAHSTPSSSGVNDHGWADAINRMIDQRYAFIAMEYENSGYLFRGMNSGLFNALLNNQFWHFSGDDRGAHLEKDLEVLLLSQDFSDALTVSKLWEQNLDACIIAVKSEIFNRALHDKKAAMMATAEPGVVFKYPFLTKSLTLDDIDYLIVSVDLSDALKNCAEFSALNNLSDSEFERFVSLVSEMRETGKLILSNLAEETSHRTVLENDLKACLAKRGVIGAKAINSKIKPTRKA